MVMYRDTAVTVELVCLFGSANEYQWLQAASHPPKALDPGFVQLGVNALLPFC